MIIKSLGSTVPGLDWSSVNKHWQLEIANLIEDLRSYILSIREADKSRDSIKVLVGEREIILTELKVPPRTLRIGGKISDKVEAQLLKFAGFEETPAGTIEMDKAWAEARIVAVEESRSLELKDVEGNIKASPIASEGLGNGSFELEGNR